MSQSEILAARFAEEGHRVRSTSSVRNPLLRTADQMASILRWRDIDVMVVDVFSGRSFRFAEIATLEARLTGRRLVLFLHGGNLPVFAPAHRDRVEKVFAAADLVLAPSEHLARTFRAWGYDVRVVPNVVETDPSIGGPRSSARPALLWMRTFHEHYDPLMAVRVVARVAQVRPDAHLTMCGADQGLFAATKAEAARLGMMDHISFPGYVRAEAKRRVLEEHDLFLNTNVVDNAPVSVLEACAAGLVPIATAVGGIPSMLDDGHDAVLVPVGEDAAMAEAVLTLLDDAERFAAMSRAAIERSRRSTWPEVRRRWDEELSLVAPERVHR
ncbi:MAG: glycosyltransferase family 4 protein [Microthrixaceae bacterium]